MTVFLSVPIRFAMAPCWHRNHPFVRRTSLTDQWLGSPLLHERHSYAFTSIPRCASGIRLAGTHNTTFQIPSAGSCPNPNHRSHGGKSRSSKNPSDSAFDAPSGNESVGADDKMI